MFLNNNEPKTTAPRSGVMLTVSAICTFFVLGWVLWSCRYGIDFADEGFYLVWISNPSKYSTSITQFGFIYHPLYALLDGSIAALRQFNILITFSLAWALSNFFLKSVLGKQTLERAPRYIIAAAFSTASLVFLRLWLPTPSYNWLAFQALLVSAIGLLLADKKASTESFAGWLLLGVGGWLAFMAKPTTAVALGLCSGLYLLASGKLNARLLATSLLTAFGLLFLSALIIDGSIINFIDRLKEGMKLAELLGAGHKFSQLFRLDDFVFFVRGKIGRASCRERV